jgi:hypothetical protein
MQRWRYTAYSHPNETIRNAAWDSIDIDRTIVAVDHSEAVALGLPPTEVFPWDDQKDIYAISAYHQFHCLAGASNTILNFATQLISWNRNFCTDRSRKPITERNLPTTTTTYYTV